MAATLATAAIGVAVVVSQSNQAESGTRQAAGSAATTAGAEQPLDEPSATDRELTPTSSGATESVPQTSERTTADGPATTGAATMPAATLTLSSDLGLAAPISRPPCDGRYITLLGAAVTTGKYADQIAGLLQQFSGSSYMRTEDVCASLRPRMPDGSDIYVVFYGPFVDVNDACEARAFGPVDAYVKVLDGYSDPTTAIDC